MVGSDLVVQARRRAGITQAELARRMGTTQSAVARIEAGTTAQSLQRIQALVAACGLTLEVRLVEPDASNVAAIRRNLELSIDERILRAAKLANFVRAGQAAMQRQLET